MDIIEDNVYDSVEDFYSHDEGWNMLLRQEYAEGFLRLEAWKGKENRDLYKMWDHITILCLYLGSAENFLGDMTADDFVDCIAWCGRNVSEFTPDYTETKAFLETIENLFKYLRSKNAITQELAPSKALKLLLADNRMNIILPDGSFDEANISRYGRSTPDVPAKIFLNIGARLQELLSALHHFFEKEYFRLDLDRAAFLYYGILMGSERNDESEEDENKEGFWDYFLFDYHLLRSDKRPLDFFYEATCLESGNSFDYSFAKRNKDVLEELCQARLTVFKIDGYNEDGAFECIDWLSGEKYALNMPLEDFENLDDALLLGHIFYNKSMIMNSVSCLKIGKVAQKRMFNILEECKKLYDVQDPGSNWAKFIERNPVLLRNMFLLYSAFVSLNDFNYEIKYNDYARAEIDEHDLVCKKIEQMMEAYHFAKRDIALAVQLWSDFKVLAKREFRMPELWASAAICNFIKANGVYSYNDEKIAELCHNVPVGAMKRMAQEIWKTLDMSEHDPRYLNEEGLLLMALS